MEEKKNYKKEISIVDKEWEAKYVKPNLGFPKGNKSLYKSFYIRINGKIKRFGVYDINHEVHHYFGSIKLYSKNSGEFEIKNIMFNKSIFPDPLFFYIDKKEGNKKILLYNRVYDESEIDDIYVFCRDASSGKIIKCYVNDKIVNEIRDIDIGEFFFCPAKPNNVLYYRNGTNDMYLLYCYDILAKKERMVGKRNKNIIYTHGINNSFKTHDYLQALDNSRKQFFDKDNVYFYFSYVSTKAFMILFDYIQNADKIEIIKNDFANDPTINYKITYSKTRNKEVEFILSILIFNEIPGISIFNYPIMELVKCFTYDDEVDKILLEYTDEHYEEKIEIINALKQKYELKSDVELLELLVDKYGRWITHNGYNSLYHFYPFSPCENREEYDRIYSKLIDEKSIKIKWKNENDMYHLIKTHFPTAIYQYHSDWLGLQSLDVYIPQLKIGFEYQGEQHFHGVEAFGGEANYNEQKERDERKRELCKENGVKLIEWLYNEKVSFHNLKNKLKEYNINIDLTKQDEVKKVVFDYNKYDVVDRINLSKNARLIDASKTLFNVSRACDKIIWVDDVHKVWTLKHYLIHSTINSRDVYHFDDDFEYYLIAYPSQRQIDSLMRKDEKCTLFYSYVMNTIRQNLNNQSYIELVINIKTPQGPDVKTIPINFDKISINSKNYKLLYENACVALNILKSINKDGYIVNCDLLTNVQNKKNAQEPIVSKYNSQKTIIKEVNSDDNTIEGNLKEQKTRKKSILWFISYILFLLIVLVVFVLIREKISDNTYYSIIIIDTLMIAISINLWIGHQAKKNNCYTIMKSINDKNVNSSIKSSETIIIIIITLLCGFISTSDAIVGFTLFIILVLITAIDLPKFVRYLTALEKVEKRINVNSKSKNNKFNNIQISDIKFKHERNKESIANEYEKELEERMDNLELEDWQKDLVREGKYDPENFEEDDSEDEDDYYHEDDD